MRRRGSDTRRMISPPFRRGIRYPYLPSCSCSRRKENIGMQGLSTIVPQLLFSDPDPDSTWQFVTGLDPSLRFITDPDTMTKMKEPDLNECTVGYGSHFAGYLRIRIRILIQLYISYGSGSFSFVTVPKLTSCIQCIFVSVEYPVHVKK